VNGASTTLETATRLCETLERIATALIDFDRDTLLETEATLAALVASFDPRGLDQADRKSLEAVVRRGRVALLRCQRLGASFSSLLRARLTAYGATTYDHAGIMAGAARSAATVRESI